MAAKTHVDNSVGERRLRPIYDWLDNGNNKKALQEADKVLKKQPNFLCAKVLKALALLRLGKEEECDQLLDMVKAEVPADDSTLQAMTICYKEIHKYDKICKIYEAATAKDPNNEELLTHLFMAYVRVADYKKQQQTALALYKLKPKNPYYFWAVMSVVMQAYKADGKLAKSVVLPLAERMVKKFVNEGKIEAEQEVQLYLMILEMQGKYDEALKIVEGPLGEKLVSYVYVPQKRATLLMKLEKWKEANVLFKSMLKEDMDRWSYITDYIVSTLKMFDAGEKLAEEHENGEDQSSLWNVPDTNLYMCRDFLRFLSLENDKLPRRLRAPYLAHLEYYKMLQERNNDPEKIVGNLIELMMTYFKNFGDKPCCVSDLKRYIPLIPPNNRRDLMMQIYEAVRISDNEFLSKAKQMQMHINCLQIERCLGLHLELTNEDRTEYLAKLRKYYEQGKKFNTENLLTEFACNDAYALLIAHILHDTWVETGASVHLKGAIVMLENALDCSPSNFHIKLLLLKFYNTLGAAGAAHKMYELLDVKHMQLDSLGYLHCGQLFSSGQFVAASTLFENTLKFFTGNYKDSIDHLTFSYKFGSFLKIEEFVEFRERLNNSLHYALTTVDKMFLELLACTKYAHSFEVLIGMEINPEEDKIDWNNLQDNRDLNIIISWEPQSRLLTSDDITSSFNDDKDLLQIRSLMLRCIAVAVEVISHKISMKPQSYTNSSANIMNGEEKLEEEEEKSCNTLLKLSDELRRVYESFLERQPKKSLKDILVAPLPSRLDTFLSSQAVRLLLELLAFLQALLQEDGIKASKLSESASELIKLAVKKVATKIEDAASDMAAHQRAILEYVVILLEMMSTAALLCGVGQSLLKPHAEPLVKKGKKKKKNSLNKQSSQSPSQCIDAFNRLVQELQTAGEELDHTLEYWESVNSLREQLIPEFQNLSIGYEEDRISLSSVERKISDSCKISVSEIRQILQIKLKYIESVKV